MHLAVNGAFGSINHFHGVFYIRHYQSICLSQYLHFFT